MPALYATRIVLVEDEPTILGLEESFLKRNVPYSNVQAFLDPHAALLELTTRSDRVDLFIFNYMMPGMTGVELAERLPQRYLGVPIILTSGAPPELADCPPGISAILPIPFDAQSLLSTVSKYLELGRKHQARLADLE